MGIDRRLILAAGAGAVAALLVIGLVATGALSGVPLLVALAAFGVLVPTSREFARRIVIGGAIFLGWIPLAWWWHLPIEHAGLLLALVIGAIVGWLTFDLSLARLAKLVPRIRRADGAVVAGAGLVAWANWPMMVAVPAQVEISRLLTGWDHTAHFNMTAMLVRHGVLINRTEEGPLGVWAYGSYPQGFHAAAATIVEAVLGKGADDPGVLLVTYVRATGIIATLAVAVVIAGVCSIPAMRRRPALAIPGGLFIASTFALGPGGMALHNGFPNFVVAVALLACIPTIAVQMTRPTSPALLAALGGAVLGVAHNWSLLLTMGAFGAVVLLVPFRGRRWPTTVRGWVPSAVISVLTLAGLGVAASMLRHQPPLGDILVTGGGASPVPPPPLYTTVALALAACVAIGLRAFRADGRLQGGRARAATSGILVLAGLATAVVIVALQLRDANDVGYYFWKYAIALQVLAAVVLVASLAFLVPDVGRRPRLTGRLGAGAVSVLASAAAVFAYGSPTLLPSSLGSGVAPGGMSRSDYKMAATGVGNWQGIRLIEAAEADDAPPDVQQLLFPFPAAPGSQPILESQWYSTLTGRWTDETQRLFLKVPVVNATTAEIVSGAREVLSENPGLRIVIGPELVDEVRDQLGTSYADRVTSW